MKRRVVVSVISDLSTDQRIYKMCITLQKGGYEVYCIGRRSLCSPPLPPLPYKTHRILCFFKKGKAMFMEFHIKLFFHLLFVRASVLCANDLDTLLPNYLVHKLRNIPLVYDTHEFYSQSPSVVHRPLVQKIWQFLERTLMPKVKTILTVNHSIAEAYQKWLKVSLKVFPNYPLRSKRIAKKPKDLNSQSIILLYQGNLHEGRGIAMMIKAMEALPQHYILWIVGDGRQKGQFQQLVAPQCKERIIFWGKIPFHYLSFITTQAHIGLSIESPHTLNTRFSLPNKLLDYLNEGLPVVVAPLPEHRKIVETYRCGVVMKAYNVDSLVQAILQLTTKPDFYRECSKNALKAIDEQMNWERQEKAILQVYETLF